MGRRCSCHGLMEALRRDPRLRLVPLGARALWLLLADALAEMPEPWVFLLGSRPGSVREIAMMVSADESETETHVQTLLDIGLLEKRADGAIAVVGLPESRRSAAAQGNGRLGGRPRKGETAEEARLRRQQTHMALPIAGGRAETQETQRKPETETRLAGADDADQKDKIDQSREVSDIVAFGAELAEIAGMDPARGTYDFRPVMNWRAMGLPDATIRDVVRCWVGRTGYTVPRSLAYFAGGMKEAQSALRGQPVAGPADRARAALVKQFLEESEAWDRGGRVGPPPVHPDRRAA